MGETTAGMTNPDDARHPIERIESDIASLRGDLGTLVAELDRRRHEALDLSHQVRRHAPAIVAIAGGVCAVGIGRMLWYAHQRRRAETAIQRLRNLVGALSVLSGVDSTRLAGAMKKLR